ELRDIARKNKNYAEADKIRDELLRRGIIVEDTPKGTIWRKRI
ncbi:MAG: CysS/YqeB C-terminal domain-containing protein, partial [bacterium]